MRVKAIIETGKNLNFDIYTDDDSLGFMLLGQGDTIEAAKADLQKSKRGDDGCVRRDGRAFRFR